MSDLANTNRQDEGKENAHSEVDPLDQRSLANRVEAEKKREADEEKAAAAKAAELPTDAARKHGNEPSKGAIIDEQLEMEEEAELAKKDAAKKQSEEAKKH
ncbi:hypothetical protein BCR37DRAFT_391389 [Protomyces lactucae-debilis]|uniref:Uncharacterized protein n=1 Tax=Protomyces lactucae-debilis TaxID=2754530 RepID=A0A1Y2FNW6_PROLT|nr:uncharacterized protein BCR37DRAFT_391389 [Protomyces lactucae-debilis]ORY85619.1 hypothetical protein BCR37DRAFT_391389 [Protomyces lactucae-debilis]